MIDDKLVKLVSHYESLHDGDLKQIGTQPKMDCIGIWTEGYGSVIVGPGGITYKTMKDRAEAYKYHKIHTVEEALKALGEGLKDFGSKIDTLGLKINNDQRSALISFAYNVGFGGLKKSSLLQHIIKGSSDAEIDAAFRAWNKGGGKVLSGLVARRTSESLLFIKGELKFFN